jgi:acyl-CoA thioesterase
MSKTKFVDIEATGTPWRFRLVVTPDMCVGSPEHRFLFGGMGLAVSIAAMERACEQPLVWATTQYLSFARLAQTIELEVRKLAASRYTTQVSVVGHSEGNVLFNAFGALGSRPGDISRHWWLAPSTPSPDDCPPGQHWRGGTEGLHARLDVRVAKGRYGRDRIGAPEPDGRLLLWVRARNGAEIDAPMLAIIADLLPNGVGNALGLNAGGSSLDNTLRVLTLRPTRWLLAEIAIHGVESGFAHGEVRMFAEDGTLLAVASQSLVMRIRDTVAG